jgi:hypothetical protein
MARVATLTSKSQVTIPGKERGVWHAFNGHNAVKQVVKAGFATSTSIILR